MAVLPVFENCEFNMEPDAYGWSLQSTPLVPGTTIFPMTFPEPIPIHFKIEWGAFFSIPGFNVKFKNILTFEGTLNGYNTNEGRPYINLSVPDSDVYFGLVTRSRSGNITITSYEMEVYEDDVYQRTDTFTTFDLDLTRNATSDFYITIYDSNLPIVFTSAEVPIDPEDPDSENYYTSNDFFSIRPVDTPELERVLTWNGNSYMEPTGESFEVNIVGGKFKVTPTAEQFIGQAYIYQFVKGKILSGKFALYPIPGISNGKLRFGIKSNAEFYALQYSVDGVNWLDTDSFPFTYFLRKRNGETGTFEMAISMGNTTVPIFSSPENAEGYINDIIGIEEADNWPEISGNTPDINNNTGDDAPATEFGNVYTRSFFNQQYICDTNAIQDISNALYDITPGGIWEDIKKGLEMFGDNPIESIVNLVYYPLNLNLVFTNTQPAPSIWFGGYEHQLSQGSANKIIYPDGYYSCGTVVLKRTFNNYRDFPPYTRIFVDIPYCGTYEIDPAKYYGKTTELRYFIDTRANGLCTASLIADSVLVDQYNGQLGVSLPIILTDFSAYANNQLNTLLGNGGQAVTGATDIASSAAGASSAIGLAGVGVGAAAFGAIQGAKTVYGLTQNNINKFNKTRGGSSAMLNQYLPQKAVFTFEIQEEDIPSNFFALNGGATNAGGNVGSFTGYLEVEQVKLNIQGATENEKERIRSLLMGGVFI